MKVSVIIPVYQAESYLTRCLDSLVSQTFQDFEVILIDDGSTDGSSKICDKYAEKDERFSVYHKTNEGVSKARQDGMNLAKGDYVIHTDPDDWTEPDYLSALYRKAESEDSDMVICDFYIECIEKTIYSKQEPSILDSKTVREELFSKLHGSTWNKLIRRSIIEENNVFFPAGVHWCEDLFFNCQLLLHELKISYVNKALYHYDRICNDNSLVDHYDFSTFEHDIRLYKMFIALFLKTALNQRG